jgi:hypothetical protein
VVTLIQELVWTESIKITGETVSASEEAAATFLKELKKFIKEEIQQPKQVFNCDKSRVF